MRIAAKSVFLRIGADRTWAVTWLIYLRSIVCCTPTHRQWVGSFLWRSVSWCFLRTVSRTPTAPAVRSFVRAHGCIQVVHACSEDRRWLVGTCVRGQSTRRHTTHAHNHTHARTHARMHTHTAQTCMQAYQYTDYSTSLQSPAATVAAAEESVA